MPVSVSQMAARVATVSIPWEGDAFKVTYFPGKLTSNTLTQLDAGDDARNEVLANLIQSWEVLADDGSMYPLDAAHLASLDIQFKSVVSLAMIRDLRPNTGASQTQS